MDCINDIYRFMVMIFDKIDCCMNQVCTVMIKQRFGLVILNYDNGKIELKLVYILQ